MFYHVFVIILNYFQISDLWVKTYLDTAVTFYPKRGVKSNSDGTKSNMQIVTS